MQYLPRCLIFIFLFSPVSNAEDLDDIPFVISGVVGGSSGSATIRQFVKYLGRKTDLNFKIYYAESYSKLSRIMREQTNSIGWTCGQPYVEDAKRDQQQLVSVPLFHNQPLYHSLIITSVNINEKKLVDFKDRVFVYSDRRSNSGYLAPSVLLKKQGFDIKQHFSLLINSGNHENSIVALLNGLADVAAIDEYIWVEYTRKFPQTLQVLHEIDRSGPYPFTPIVAGKDISLKTVKKLRKTLVNMSDDPQGKEILKRLGLDGFVNKKASFYQPIQQMMDLLETNKHK